jgi:hypothetical protein
LHRAGGAHVRNRDAGAAPPEARMATGPGRVARVLDPMSAGVGEFFTRRFTGSGS